METWNGPSSDGTCRFSQERLHCPGQMHVSGDEDAGGIASSLSRFPTVEGPPEDTRELLENNAIYRIELAEGDGRHLEFLVGKTDSGVSWYQLSRWITLAKESSSARAKETTDIISYPFTTAVTNWFPVQRKQEKERILFSNWIVPYTMHVWKVEKNNSDSLSLKFEATGLYWEASEKGKFDVHLAHKKSTDCKDLYLSNKATQPTPSDYSCSTERRSRVRDSKMTIIPPTIKKGRRCFR